MKRSEFVRQLLADGCILVRHGAKHDVYINPATSKKQTVPRHTEIDNVLARHIRTRLGFTEPRH
ncbi:MAG: type II toxin-antitoxin system HicA family toxin [Deltaproteobacteria bacterium]|nr:type II toxin-antitoxin system HicA family toxin [Deltaproteobacteria bacterium]